MVQKKVQMHKAKLGLKYLYIRKNVYIYRRPIPSRFHILADQTEFKSSLKTRIENTALQAYADADEYYDSLFDRMAKGESVKSALSYDLYAAKARSQGRTLSDFAELSANPPALLHAHSAFQRTKKNNPDTFNSFFNASANDICISRLVEVYEQREAYRLQPLNENERRKRLNPRKRAIAAFIEHLGEDRPISEITKSDVDAFYERLNQKIAQQKIVCNTANKYLIHLRTMLSGYQEKCGKSKATHFDGLHFKGQARSGDAYDINFIKTKWLTGDPFKTMNKDAKNILLAMIDTGCLPKELCGLTAADIVLDGDIPYIHIRPNELRGVKTIFRERRIPLVGYALQAFTECPTGFAKYSHDKGPENASNAIRKFLIENNINQSVKHSPKSLRHLFKNRMREHSISAEIQDKLMGHQHQGMGPKYGNITLKQKYNAMKKLSSDFT